MKVLVVMPYYYPHIGGLERHVRSILLGLISKYRYEIVVVAANHNGRRYSVEYIDGIKVYRLPYFLRFSNTPVGLSWYKRISHIVSVEKPDVINGRGPVPFISDITSSIARKKGVPFVLGWHFPTMRKGDFISDIIIFIYESIFFPIMLKNSRKIICSSEYVRETLFNRYKNITSVITQGLDEKRFRKIAISRSKNAILFVGSLQSRVKGLEYLLSAMSILSQRGVLLTLNVVGPGDVYFYKKICKRLGIVSHVNFRGSLSGDLLVEEYNKNMIFVSPSTSDNFPSTILEAMLCELPVVASSVGNIPYFISHKKNGVLVPPGNAMALADGIESLLVDDKFLVKVAKAGCLSVKEKFSWEEKVEQTHKVFTQVLV